MRFYGFADDASGLFGFAELRHAASIQCRPAASSDATADILFRGLARLSRPEGPALLALAAAEARARGYRQLVAFAEPGQRDWYRRHGFAASRAGSPVMLKDI